MNINLTLLGQMITFAIFIWFCMKYIWPPIVKALEERRSKIAEGLAAAERGREEQKIGQKRALEVINEAKAQASDILAMAQKRASEIVDAAKNDAKAEGDRIIGAAQAEVDLAKNQAREELRAKVSELSIAAAEKILRKEINPKTHQALIDEFAKQI